MWESGCETYLVELQLLPVHVSHRKRADIKSIPDIVFRERMFRISEMKIKHIRHNVVISVRVISNAQLIPVVLCPILERQTLPSETSDKLGRVQVLRRNFHFDRVLAARSGRISSDRDLDSSTVVSGPANSRH